MPINVTCSSCGQKFAAKEELAGKKVRCPKCSNPLVIPSPQVTANVAQVASGMDDLFDEAGIEATPSGGARCPSCFSPMQQNSVICINCGLNLQTGERAEGFAALDSKNKHPMFRQAEGELAEEAREKRKSVDPVPWFYYVGALGLLAFNAWLFSTIWYETLESSAPTGFKSKYVFGWLTFMFVTEVPVALLFFGHFAIVTWTFYEDTVNQRLLTLFVPLYDFIYLVQHLKEKSLRIPFVLYVVGLIWGIVAVIMHFGTGTLVIPTLIE